MNTIFNSVIQILDSSDEFHVPGSEVYSALEVIVNNYRKIFAQDVTIELFGKETLVTAVQMGNIGTADLFVIHEFILFQKYLKLKKDYVNFIDIGANIGVHSLIARNLGYQVFSYEPDPCTFEILEKNIKLNRGGVKLYNKAVSAYDGKHNFIRVEDNLTASGLADSTKKYYGRLKEIQVEVMDINKVLKPKSVVKIDAEGSEYKILSAINYDVVKDLIFLVEISDADSRGLLWSLFSKKEIKMYSQKKSWLPALGPEDLPSNWREGSFAIKI
jgi:FkbM family methyltransferase